MFARGLRSAFTLLLGVFSFIILNPVHVQCTLCEARCEHAVPNLVRLKQLWHANQKRVGGEDVSFRSFIKYLYIASQKYHRLNPLRDGIIAMVTEYRDCVKACEHQHSKRNGDKQYWNQYTIRLPWNIHCDKVWRASLMVMAHDNNDRRVSFTLRSCQQNKSLVINDICFPCYYDCNYVPVRPAAFVDTQGFGSAEC